MACNMRPLNRHVFNQLLSRPKIGEAGLRSFSVRQKVSPEVDARITDFASRPLNAITLQQMLAFGRHPQTNRLVSCQWLHTELPTRCAHHVRQLESFPIDFPSEHFEMVRQLYIESFSRLTAFPRPSTLEQDAVYTELLADIKARHSVVVPLLSRGILEMKQKMPQIMDRAEEVSLFLDNFYMARIALRMLIGQHVTSKTRPGGRIDVACSPREIAIAAGDSASTLCRQYYGVAPGVEFLGLTNLTLTYVPSHMQHMLFELLKNSMRATIEAHGKRNPENLPKIRVVIAEGEEDVVLKISDRGGGIPLSGLDTIWSYLYTTAEIPGDVADLSFRAQFGGHGYGLPVSRLFARYFGGDLQVISMEGYGTDAFLHVSRLTDVQERLMV